MRHLPVYFVYIFICCPNPRVDQLVVNISILSSFYKVFGKFSAILDHQGMLLAFFFLVVSMFPSTFITFSILPSPWIVTDLSFDCPTASGLFFYAFINLYVYFNEKKQTVLLGA